MPAPPPAGTVTFLCTAVDEATGRWDDGVDVDVAALERGELIGRQAVERHGGYVFARSDEGLAAAFGTAPDAAEAAVELQQRMLADATQSGSRSPSGCTPVTRSTAPARTSGPEVNRAARLMSTRARRAGPRVGRDRGAAARPGGAARAR